MDRVEFQGLPDFIFGIARQSLHRYGHLNQELDCLCLIYGEINDEWVGRWLTVSHEAHIGYCDVLFSKKTTILIDENGLDGYRGIINSIVVRQKMAKHTSDLAGSLK